MALSPRSEAEGGISAAAQEDEARERDAELARDIYIGGLDRQLHELRRRVLGILRTDGSKRDLETAIDLALWMALKLGVEEAASGQKAEWILEEPSC